MPNITEKLRGIALCLAISIVAWLLGQQLEVVGGPVFGILIGMLLAVALRGRDTAALQPGIKFTSKYVLQAAVIFLGFGLNLSQIAKVGVASLPVIASTIVISLIVAFVVCRVMKVPGKIATLIGVGSSICGGSAIAATAPVIRAKAEDVAQAISVIFLFNVIAALIFPTLGSMLGLTNEGFGLFAGTAINDTSSVTAAAAVWDGMHPGANTLDEATIVKLTRTLAIIPITLVLAIWQMRAGRRAGSKNENAFSLRRAFPTFVGLFVLASIVTTVFALPTTITAPLKTFSIFLIVMAMSAIGLNTDIVKLVKSGGKPIALGACCWIAIALVSLGVQHLIGIW